MPKQMRTKKIFFDMISHPALKNIQQIKKMDYSASVIELLGQPNILSYISIQISGFFY